MVGALVLLLIAAACGLVLLGLAVAGGILGGCALSLLFLALMAEA